MFGLSLDTILSLDKRICAACDSETTTRKKSGYENWRVWDNFWLCKPCFDKYVWTPIRMQIYDKRRISFKGRRIILNENPRKGLCKKCKKRFKLTHMHHKKYDADNPSKYTEELCASCHGKLLKVSN